jgi:hypothetical protein
MATYQASKCKKRIVGLCSSGSSGPIMKPVQTSGRRNFWSELFRQYKLRNVGSSNNEMYVQISGSEIEQFIKMRIIKCFGRHNNSLAELRHFFVKFTRYSTTNESHMVNVNYIYWRHKYPPTPLPPAPPPPTEG